MGITLSEVEVLRWFEESPAEKAEVVFSFVAEKTRQRLQDRRGETQARPEGTGMPRKRLSRPGGDVPADAPAGKPDA